MTVVIQLVGLASGDPTPFDGEYLAEYNPTIPGVDPEGQPMTAHVVTVKDPADAIHYADAGVAMTAIRQNVGSRPDGKPDRPLTAFTTAIVSYDRV